MAGGNQVDAPVTAPVTVGGNAVAVADDASVENPGTPGTPSDTPGTPDTPGDTPDDRAEPDEDAANTSASTGPASGDPSGDVGLFDEDGTSTSASTGSVAVTAASAIPNLARTGFAPGLLALGVLALLAGLGLTLAVRRFCAVAER